MRFVRSPSVQWKEPSGFSSWPQPLSTDHPNFEHPFFLFLGSCGISRVVLSTIHRGQMLLSAQTLHAACRVSTFSSFCLYLLFFNLLENKYDDVYAISPTATGATGARPIRAVGARQQRKATIRYHAPIARHCCPPPA